jgi:hypothetical protein
MTDHEKRWSVPPKLSEQYCVRREENIGIWHADNTSRAGILEIDRGLTAAQAKNDLLVEVCISQESRPHALELGAPFRAASSLE